MPVATWWHRERLGGGRRRWAPPAGGGRSVSAASLSASKPREQRHRRRAKGGGGRRVRAAPTVGESGEAAAAVSRRTGWRRPCQAGAAMAGGWLATAVALHRRTAGVGDAHQPREAVRPMQLAAAVSSTWRRAAGRCRGCPYGGAARRRAALGNPHRPTLANDNRRRRDQNSSPLVTRPNTSVWLAQTTAPCAPEVVFILAKSRQSRTFRTATVPRGRAVNRRPDRRFRLDATRLTV